MMCQVCGAPDAEPHFGGESCRSTKIKRKEQNQSTMCTFDLKFFIVIMQYHPPRMLQHDIYSLKLDRSRQKRKLLYGDSQFEMNFTQFSNVTKPDTLLLWDLAAKIFPDVKLLSVSDKNAILCNFFPRWMMLDSALGICTNYEESLKYIVSKDYTDMLLHFYGTSMPKEKRLNDEEIIRIWKPYWDFHFYETAVPIHFKKLDKVEYMAIFMMLLFDDAYANISDDGSTLCRNLRKVVKRELKGYQIDHNCYEKRFIEVMDVLLILEKAEEKIQEEVVIAGLNNITLNDDFKSIFHVKKL